jgi:hypothetical protein
MLFPIGRILHKVQGQPAAMTDAERCAVLLEGLHHVYRITKNKSQARSKLDEIARVASEAMIKVGHQP